MIQCLLTVLRRKCVSNVHMSINRLVPQTAPGETAPLASSRNSYISLSEASAVHIKDAYKMKLEFVFYKTDRGID